MFLWRLLTYYVNIAFGGLFSVWGGKKYQAKTERKNVSRFSAPAAACKRKGETP